MGSFASVGGDPYSTTPTAKPAKLPPMYQPAPQRQAPQANNGLAYGYNADGSKAAGYGGSTTAPPISSGASAASSQSAATVPPPSTSISAPAINIPQPTALTNTASDNADTRYLIDRIKAQTTGPGTSNAAIQQAGQAIGQFAEGARNQLGDSLARRGMLNSGAQDSLGGEITNKAQQQFGQAASNIALGRQNQVDQTLLGAQGIFAEPGRQQLAQQGVGIQQFQAQNQAAQGAAGLQLQQQALQNQAQQAAYNAQLQQQALAQQQMTSMTNLYSNLYQ